MSSLSEKKTELLEELSMFPDANARLEHLIDLVRDQPPLPAEFRTDRFRVEGCMSSLWIVPDFHDGCCYFPCDADSLVVKSIAGLLCEFYGNAAPADILAMSPEFLREAGITQHLSSNRRNALSRVWETIREFAEANLNLNS